MAPDVVSSSFVITSGMTSGVGGSGQAIIVQALKPFSPQVQRLHPSDERYATLAQYVASPSSQVLHGSQAIMVQASGVSPPEQVLQVDCAKKVERVSE